jgi:hypothetical protein
MTTETIAVTAGPLARPDARSYWARIRGLLLAPGAEWAVIAEERPTTRQLFVRWVLPFSLVFFLAPQLGTIIFMPSVAPSLAQALYTTIVGTALMAGGVYALAFIIDAMARPFDAGRDAAQAMKLAVYSGTGLWLSGLVGLAPPLGLLAAAGVVSLYTLYRGIPVMTGAPQDKALAYTAAIAAAGATLGVVLMALASCVTLFDAPPPRTKAAAPAPVVVLAPRTADAATARDPEKLRRLLPDAMAGGWVRAGLARNGGGVLGFTGPTVAAVYENGRQRIVLSVVDLGPEGAARAIAALEAAEPAQDDARALVQHTHGPDGYAFEAFDRRTGDARLLTVAGDRIALVAEGRGASFADVRAAMAMVDRVRLEQIARGM